MNPKTLSRFAVAVVAAAACALAQAAPAERSRPRSEPRGDDRVQVRLAEVIALLEEEDLTPDQRAKARAKLEDIVAQLRRRADEVIEFRGGDLVVRTQQPAAPAEAPQPPSPPKPAKAPKPPKAPKPAKAAEPVIVEVAPAEPGERERVRVRKLRAETEAEAHGAEAGQRRVWLEFAEHAQKAAEQARAHADKVRAESRMLLERAHTEAIDMRDRAEGARRALLERKARADAEGEAEAPRARLRVRTVDVPSAGEPADGEIRALIEQMRAEMREIREMMLQLRKQARQASPTAPAGIGQTKAFSVRSPGSGLGGQPAAGERRVLVQPRREYGLGTTDVK